MYPYRVQVLQQLHDLFYHGGMSEERRALARHEGFQGTPIKLGEGADTVEKKVLYVVHINKDGYVTFSEPERDSNGAT